MNITFDLETLGNKNDAPIVQIGAVKFTDKGEILDKFIRNIDLEKLDKYNFRADYRTINWWLNQKNKAIKSVFGYHLEKVSLDNALYDFEQWIGKPSNYVYWSHATFDPPILDYNYMIVGRVNPISFRLHRDIRTLTHFSGEISIKRKGIAHNALDDCIFQAEYISKGLQIIKNK
jgi:exodeoxyribonuclease VIII